MNPHMKKNYYIQERIGRAKYVASFHDGKDTHKDGSPFYHIKIFSNKRELTRFEKQLLNDGYTYQ